jgi:hypothetical protein
MFILDEELLKVSLDKINLLVLTYYNTKSELFNIYDTNYNFNENIVPLITSVLETQPYILQAKKYNNLHSESIIINNNCNKSKLPFPSLYNDIRQNNLQYVQVLNRNLVNTLDMKDDKILIRMYNATQKAGEYSKNMINEEEQTVIMWWWEHFNLQLIINKDMPNVFQMHLNIYILEDNKFITSRIQNINNILQKLQTINFFMDTETYNDNFFTNE